MNRDKSPNKNSNSGQEQFEPDFSILSSLIENVNASIWAVDKNYRLLFGNSVFQENCRKGLGESLKIGISVLFDALTSDEKTEWKGYYNRAIKGEKFSIERKRKYSSTPTWNVYHFGPVLNDTGEHIGASVIAHDITEQVMTQNKLNKSNQRFEELVEMLPDAVFEMDTNFKLTYANQQALDLFGYTSEDVTKGLNGLEMLAPDHRDVAKTNFAKRIKGEKTGTVEYSGLKKDGSVFPVLFHANSVFEDGKLKGIRGIIIDISEKKKSELRQEQLVQMLDVAPNAIMIHDFNGKMLYANQKTFDVHNYTKEEFMSLSLQNIDTPESAKYIPERMEVLKKNGEAHFEVEHIKKDGTVFPMEVHVLLTTWGEKNAVISVGTDITKRKKNETELRNNEAFLEETQKIASLGIYTLDVHSGIWECSELMDDVLGIDANYEKSIEGWVSTIHPDWQKIMADYFAEEVLGKKINFNKEYKIIRQNDREERWVHGLGRLEFNESGEPIKMIGTIRDITEQKTVELHLLHTQEMLNQTGRIAKVGGWQLNVLTMETFFTEETFHIYELPVGSVPTVEEGMRFYAPEAQPIIKEVVTNAIEKNIPYDIEVPFITAKGRRIWVRTTGQGETKNGKVVRLFGIIQDITELKKAEIDLIRAKEKAIESDRLKSAFLANMSHEIRTPMNGILGFANLLKEPQLSGEVQNKYIDIIEKSGERMLNTINDIVDISKIEAGQVEILISNVNVKNKLEGIFSFFKPEADKKGIKLLSECELKSNEVKIKSDKEKLQAILTNLVKNAIKFCDKGSIRFGCIRKGEFLEFYVKDTGKGIPENRLKAIFDRFIQADIEDREAKEGSGLGLAISKSYVELMGGKIWVESKKGKGSNFYFTIPYHPVSE